MPAEPEFDAEDFSDRLAAMGDAELFSIMQGLEDESAGISAEERYTNDVFAKIALVETAVGDRFPGQLLAPYKDWQKRRAGIE